jgi:uncharacterized protein YbjQ (UPF0145 family)
LSSGGRGGNGRSAERALASQQAIEAGGIPLEAQARLDEVRRRGGAFFTSDLTTNEFLLLRRAGFRPVTQVMGSCFYNTGWQWLPQGSGGLGGGWGATYAEGQTLELETQTEAWNEARRRALSRLEEEARRAGAHAVVGVHLERGAYDWAAGLIEFTAVGTAVVSDRYELGEEPVLSNLTGQQFVALLEHGFWPVGLVAASTVAYVMTGWQQQRGLRGGLLAGWSQNQELTDFTRGVYETRTQTMGQVSRQAHELHAHGVVGVELHAEHHEHERDVNSVHYTDLILTMHVLGTAVVELAGASEPPPVYVALPLSEEHR